MYDDVYDIIFMYFIGHGSLIFNRPFSFCVQSCFIQKRFYLKVSENGIKKKLSFIKQMDERRS